MALVDELQTICRASVQTLYIDRLDRPKIFLGDDFNQTYHDYKSRASPSALYSQLRTNNLTTANLHSTNIPKVTADRRHISTLPTVGGCFSSSIRRCLPLGA
ncbi:hypothetical protein QUA79_30475 [Microcoleus sp. F8-D1]